MKETGEILTQFGSQLSLVRFVLLLVPGFVALQLYDLRAPSERRKIGEIIVSLVVYSLFCDVFGVGYLALLHLPIPDEHTPLAELFFFGLVVGFVVPGLLGWFMFDLRQWLSRIGLALDPMPKAWDVFFRRLAQKKKPFALVITLNDGRRVGGFWDGFAFTSTYPCDEDILIGTPCVIDQTTGSIVARISGSQGLLLKRDDILSIEAFDYVEPDASVA